MSDLKAFRKANNLKQTELANYLGVSREYLSLVETGKSKLSAEKVSMLLTNPYGWDTSSITPDEKQKESELVAALKETISAQRETIEYQKEIIATLRMGGDSSSCKGCWYCLFPFTEVIEA